MSDLCRSDAAYVLGALSPSDRHAYEDHFRGCDACQASVQRIAGIPGLLALTSDEAVEDPGPPVPETLLPSLIARVRAARRRRRWVTGSLLAAAAAAVLVVSGVLVVQNAQDALNPGGTGTAGATTSSGTAPAVPDEQTSMIAVVPGPMTASLELTDRRWGTAITVICSYTDSIDSSASYDLSVIDTEGGHSPAGSWRAVPGATARVAVATAVPRDRIASLEVLLPDGRTILRSTA